LKAFPFGYGVSRAFRSRVSGVASKSALQSFFSKISPASAGFAFWQFKHAHHWSAGIAWFVQAITSEANPNENFPQVF
jgi:hypothetical protein